MASTPDFVAFVLDQLEEDIGATSKKMFGEYGLFAGGKMFGMVCDDRFFLKPTDGVRARLGPDAPEAPPYPGAKRIPVLEDLDDRAELSALVRIAVAELPEPRRRGKSRGKGG